MRQMISGMVAAAAVLVAGAAPAAACGWNPCAPVVAPVFSGCNTGCGGYGYGAGYGAGYEQLAEPTSQYYYVNQGPTYTGPGAFAPTPTYQESGVVTSGYGYGYGAGYGYRARPYGYGYGARAIAPYRPYYRPYRYGYGPRMGYLPRVSYGARYGYAHRAAPGYYGHRALRRYY